MFFLLPFLILAKISVSEMENVVFKDLITYKEGLLQLQLKLGNYLFIGQDPLYVKTYLASLQYAGATTLLALFIGYPFAYFMARAKATIQPALLMLVMLPFWTSFLLRVYAWKGLLSEHGWVSELLIALRIDHVLLAMGVIPALGKFMNSPFSLVLGMTYTYLPFMILPLFGNLAKLTKQYQGAADGAVDLVSLVVIGIVEEHQVGLDRARRLHWQLWVVEGAEDRLAADHQDSGVAGDLRCGA